MPRYGRKNTKEIEGGVIRYMRENKEPNLDILTKALALKDSSRITEEHLELSIKIYNKRVVMAIAVPNTEHVYLLLS